MTGISAWTKDEIINPFAEVIAKKAGIDPSEVTPEYVERSLKESRKQYLREAFDEGHTISSLDRDFNARTIAQRSLFFSTDKAWQFFERKLEEWDAQNENSPTQINHIGIKHGFNFRAAGIEIKLPFLHMITVNVAAPQNHIA